MATKMLSEKLGEVEYDNLIVGLTPPKRVGAGKIASTGSKEATYTRGTVFAKSAKDGKLYILGSTAASGDTLTADCILTDDVTVPATGDATTTVYLAGCFNPDKLVVTQVFATPGPILKRMMPRAQGRAYRINKRTSHVTLAVAEKN